jgi:hypothetical protein
MKLNLDEINQILKEHFDKVTPEEFRSNIEAACPYLLDNSVEAENNLVSAIGNGLHVTHNGEHQEINQILKEHFDKVTPEEFRSNIEVACPYLLDNSVEAENNLVSAIGNGLHVTHNGEHQEVNMGQGIETNNSQSQEMFADPYSPPPLKLSYAYTTSKVALADSSKISFPNKARKWFDNPLKLYISATLLLLLAVSTAIFSNLNYKNTIHFGNGKGNHKDDFPITTNLAPIPVGESSVYPYIRVSDKSGKTADINVIVLSSKYRWKIGEDKLLVNSLLDNNSSENTIDITKLNEKLKKDGVYELIKSEGGISRVISVGTASCEGSLVKEEARAKQRALATIKLVGMKMFEVSHYSFINLGRFKKADCNPLPKETSWQRSVIILGVRQEDDGINITEAVRERLMKIPIELQDYSLGNKEFKVINITE